MFVTCLKHEWRANRGLIGLMCAVIGSAGLLSGGTLRYTVWSSITGNNAAMALYAFVLSAAMVAGLVCFMLPTYLLVYRFYQSRFTDRGYLMLTLPVTTHQQLLSSIACTVIGVVLVTIAGITSFAVGISFFLSMFNDVGAAELVESIKAAMRDAGYIEVLLDYHVGIQMLPSLIAFLADIILLMLAVTIGAQSGRHPVLKAVALYVLTDLVVSKISTLIDGVFGHIMMEMMCACLIYTIVAVGAYFIMHHIITKRLNLM